MHLFIFKDFPEIKIYDVNIKEARKKLIELGKYFYEQQRVIVNEQNISESS
jgi:hypothetical protein